MSLPETAYITVYIREVFLQDVAKAVLGGALQDMIKTEMEVIMSLLPEDVSDPADQDMVEAYAKEWADFVRGP